MFQGNGLGERIRTSGLLNPIQARYQTALHPVILLELCHPEHGMYYRILWHKSQVFFEEKQQNFERILLAAYFAFDCLPVSNML